MEEIEDTFEKYSGKGFFVIDMKFVNDEFINDVKADIALLESIYLEWFGEEDVIKFDPKLNRSSVLFVINSPKSLTVNWLCLASLPTQSTILAQL